MKRTTYHWERLLIRFQSLSTSLSDIKIVAKRQHCMKSVRIRSYSGPDAGKYGPEQLRIRTLFTHCIFGVCDIFSAKYAFKYCDWKRKCAKFQAKGRKFLLNFVIFKQLKLTKFNRKISSTVIQLMSPN